MRLFHQVDVFADEFPYGNPVAVVHNADDLSTTDMAAIARWTNLAETTFLLTPTHPSADYRLRIFTISRELPFAGHATLGAARAWLAAGNTPSRAGRIEQQCGAGPVRIRSDADLLWFAAPPLLRDTPVTDYELRTLAAGLRIEPEQITAARWADNGPGWVVVLLASAEAVLAITPDYERLSGFSAVGVVGPHPAGSEALFEVRAFTDEGTRWEEDPVTGSLNAAVAQWLIPAGGAPARYTATQGAALQRRGRIHLSHHDGEIWVGGRTALGITGQWH